MSRIKVTVATLEVANELIDYWKDKDVELLIDVKPDGTFLGKENTTTENSDVIKQVKTKEIVKLMNRESLVTITSGEVSIQLHQI